MDLPNDGTVFWVVTSKCVERIMSQLKKILSMVGLGVVAGSAAGLGLVHV
jgi:hypothetical protein